jgi:hypothetical protein
MLAQPPGLAMTQLGQTIVVAGAEGRLRVANQDEFRHRCFRTLESCDTRQRMVDSVIFPIY